LPGVLELNGVAVTGIPNEEVRRFVMSVAAGGDDVARLAEQLRRLAGR
jgi:prophage maintenance system killer protein